MAPKRAITPTSAEHVLITAAREHFAAASQGKHGYLRPAKRVMVDVVASRATLQDALDVADQLFRALHKRGHVVGIAPQVRDVYPRRPRAPRDEPDVFEESYWWPYRPTTVSLGGVQVGLTLYEVAVQRELRNHGGRWTPVEELPAAVRRVPARTYDTQHKWVPSGELCVRAFSTRTAVPWQEEWTRGPRARVSTWVEEVVRRLEEIAPTLAARNLDADKKEQEAQFRWKAELEESRRREAVERQRAARKASHDELLAIIDGWSVSERIAAFLDQAERVAGGVPDEERARMAARIEEARALLSGTNALERLLTWKTPQERLTSGPG